MYRPVTDDAVEALKAETLWVLKKCKYTHTSEEVLQAIFEAPSMRRVLEQFAASAPAVVSGDWVMVPREPTEAMLDAFWRGIFQEPPGENGPVLLGAGYDAMLASAPNAPVAERFENCTENLRQQGKPYPRTCKVCGLGPCRARKP